MVFAFLLDVFFYIFVLPFRKRREIEIHSHDEKTINSQFFVDSEYAVVW